MSLIRVSGECVKCSKPSQDSPTQHRGNPFCFFFFFFFFFISRFLPLKLHFFENTMAPKNFAAPTFNFTTPFLVALLEKFWILSFLKVVGASKLDLLLSHLGLQNQAHIHRFRFDSTRIFVNISIFRVKFPFSVWTFPFSVFRFTRRKTEKYCQ